jgi:UDP-N-acetylglucosamine acyltransferase
MTDIYDINSRFDSSNKIHSTAIIHDCVEMGKNNTIGAYCVIGGDGEIRGVHDFKGKVIIGNGNKISELVTIQRPEKDGSNTEIGDNNIIMAHSHLGHDSRVGNNCEIACHSILGGYTQIADNVKIKLNCTIRNRKTIGSGSLIGMGSNVVCDVPANEVWMGNPARMKHEKATL